MILNKDYLLDDCIAKMVRDLENLFVIRRSRFQTGMDNHLVPANDNRRLMVVSRNANEAAN